MPTIVASSLISKAEILAQDTTNIRWTESEWLGWLNDGQREICIAKPSACSKISTLALAVGTKQSIPADGIQFLDLIRNMGVGGATPGATARKVDRRILDAGVPGWHSETAAAAVKHVVFEPLSPRTFYVYPPNTGTGQVEILYSAAPTDVAAVGNAITVDDIYATVLIDYMLYRAYSKDSEFVGNAERALMYRKAFEGALGTKTNADAAAQPLSNPRG